MTVLKSFLFVLLLGITSCCTSKKNIIDVSAEKTAEVTVTDNSSTSMKAQGYSEGVIIASETEGDCPFVIEINDENYPYFLDPINLTEAFEIANQKVWFRFQGLRMPNRCEKANPISLIDIKKRVE